MPRTKLLKQRETASVTMDKFAFEELTAATKRFPFKKVDLLTIAALHLVRDFSPEQILQLWTKHMTGQTQEGAK